MKNFPDSGRQKCAGGMTQVVEDLPSKMKHLIQAPVLAKNDKIFL
jgi:hypothetical protein